MNRLRVLDPPPPGTILYIVRAGCAALVVAVAFSVIALTVTDVSTAAALRDGALLFVTTLLQFFRLDSRRLRSREVGHSRRLRELTDGLADHFLANATRRLPEAHRDRWHDEWLDHRDQLHGWRLVWWAWGVRTAARRISAIVREPEVGRGLTDRRRKPAHPAVSAES